MRRGARQRQSCREIREFPTHRRLRQTHALTFAQIVVVRARDGQRQIERQRSRFGFAVGRAEQCPVASRRPRACRLGSGARC